MQRQRRPFAAALREKKRAARLDAFEIVSWGVLRSDAAVVALDRMTEDFAVLGLQALGAMDSRDAAARLAVGAGSVADNQRERHVVRLWGLLPSIAVERETVTSDQEIRS